MAVYLNNGEFISTLSEAAGFKTGVALSKSQIISIFPKGSCFNEILSLDSRETIRIHSSDIDELFIKILYHLGNIKFSTSLPSTIRLREKYKQDNSKSSIFNDVLRLYLTHWELMMDKAEENSTKILDPTDFMTEAAKKFGKSGLSISYDLIAGNGEDLHCKLSGCRRFEWKNIIELEDLFKSESLESKYGRFIDQRYIDYLSRNKDKLGEINWRKFEGLTAEFFDREGYRVNIGPGRNDGGVDIRVWNDDDNSEDPPLILIQCKRHKNKIERETVKALWADVQWENAGSGLIVTTSSIAPGAERDCVARGYNISQANKDIVCSWLKNMRTPGNGYTSEE